MRRCVPVHPEHVQALVEIRSGTGVLDMETILGLADAAHAPLRGVYRCPPPDVLCHANGLVLVRSPDLLRLALYVDGRVYWRPCSERTRIGFALYHELAEAILERWRCRHADVQLLTLALLGAGDGPNRHAPRWALRVARELRAPTHGRGRAA